MWLFLFVLTHFGANALSLGSLERGELLKGTIVGHHRNEQTGKFKLFVRVPVERPGRAGQMKPTVDAYLDVPPAHPLRSKPETSLGKPLTVRVVKAQPEAGRLRVSLSQSLSKPPPALTQRAPGLERLSRRARNRRARKGIWYRHRLEDLSMGTQLNATVLSVHPFGAIVDVGVTRAGAGGTRAPVDALLPADQLPVGATAATFLVPGRTIGVRVLRPSPGSGRLLLTAVPVASTASLETMLEQRALARRRADRRPSLKELSAQPGTEREGVVVKVASYGVVVNVGARRPGLVHISKLQSGGGRKGAFIERVEAVCEVGDRVVVQVLPKSTAQRLSLRLIRVFPRDESERAQALALLRRDETLDPRFARFEDAEIGGKFVSAAEAVLAVDEAAAWAAYETQADDEEEEADDEEDDEEEEDPWAWAAASAEGTQGAASQAPQEDEDPWAWAAADIAADSADDSNEVVEEQSERIDEDSEAEAPNFDQSYFEDKYDLDTY
jgi:predicted RNA-binding protein with RPS1 domain